MPRIRIAATLALVSLVAFLSPGSSIRAASPDIVISQVYGGGGNTGSTYRNDFIELYNRGSFPVDITGWTVQYASASGSTWAKTTLSGTLPPGSYYLIREAAQGGGTVSLPTPDATGTIQMSATGGKVALVTNSTTLTGYCPTANVRDFVGYGTTILTNCYETAPIGPLSNITAALRKDDGATDTDDNSADFTIGAPYPRNSSIIVPPPPLSLAIHTLQGTGLSSPYVGQLISTRGIVTALKSNGFFLQAADADVDADATTSEAVFVFTNGSPTVLVGNDVSVTGTVSEYFDLTEIFATGTTVNGTTTLPTPLVLTSDILNPAGTAYQLERFEGMRLHADALVAVGPTNSFGEIEAVLAGVGRPMREPGIARSFPVPPDPVAGAVDCCIPRWDENLERIMIDSDGIRGMSAVTVTSNVTFTDVTGPLDYTFSRYKLLPELPLVSGTLNMTAVPVPAPAANEFTVAGYNIENFGNDNTQRRKAALAIRDVMRLPDVIGTIEILDLATLQALATEVNTLAMEEGQPDPQYEAHLIPASADATQNIGFLVKGSRIRVDEVTQEGAAEQFVNPADGVSYTLHDRPPLVLRATLNPNGSNPENIIVVVNHPRSFIDIDLVSATGVRVREKRTKQAESIAALLQKLQVDNPKTPVISVGDYNAYEFSDGYTDPVSVIKGTPTPGDQIVVAQSPDLVNPNFANLTDRLPADQRYSFVFEGTAQALDHVFISDVADRIYQRYAIARSNADFPETPEYTNDAARPERSSDHDMPVAYFAFPGTPVVQLAGGATMTAEAYGDPFTDPGATAHDDTGTLTVSATGTVDINTPGEYLLSYTAANFFHTTTVTRTVRVADTIGPAIKGFAVTPNLLWPPNHRMVDVSAYYTASDASELHGGFVTCSLGVTSSDPQNGLGDGDTDVDWQVFGPTALQLRAERSAPLAGRTYSVAVTCEDNAGNRTVQSAPVAVPRNR